MFFKHLNAEHSPDQAATIHGERKRGTDTISINSLMQMLRPRAHNSTFTIETLFRVGHRVGAPGLVVRRVLLRDGEAMVGGRASVAWMIFEDRSARAVNDGLG